MHEMSIVIGILRIAEEQATAADAKIINSIELEIGRLAGIEIESLEFCFEAARKSTMAAGASLVVIDIPGIGHCPECAQDVPMDYPLGMCVMCGQVLLEASQGQELRVKSINVD